MVLKVSKDNLIYDRLEDKDSEVLIKQRKQCIVRAVKECALDWSTRRQELETIWASSWAHYFSTPHSAQWLRERALDLGQSQDENDWRHKVHTGKGFDLVETVNSYLQQAFFPAEDWFDLSPCMPPPEDSEDSWYDRVNRVKKLMQRKLKEANFEDWWDIFCRQLCVVGTSVIALPYRFETKPTMRKVPTRTPEGTVFRPKLLEKVIRDGLDIEVVDMFNFFIDPDSAFSGVVDSNCIRRLTKTKAEVIRLIDEGVYSLGSVEDVRKATRTQLTNYSQTNLDDLQRMVGLQYSDQFRPSDVLEIIEYWGDLYLEDIVYRDVVVTILDETILSMETNPFWDGKPFIVGTYVNTQGSPYGVSLLQPVLGQLHQMFEIQNHRLDCDELIVNPMYVVVDDGVVDLENLYSEPAKLIPVADINNIKPLPIDRGSNISINDEGLLNQSIEKTTGVGAYLGVNSGRNAERVTAEEVKAQRDAGGNRLNRIHSHIETTSLFKFLTKMYSHLQQFVSGDVVVKVPARDKGVIYEFWVVGEQELQDDYEIHPLGASHIADKEYEIKNAVDYASIMSGNQELAQRANWDEVANHITRKFMRDNWEKFVTKPEVDISANTQPTLDAPVASMPASVPTQGQPQVLPTEGGVPSVNPFVGEMSAVGGKPAGRYAQELLSNPEALVEFMKQKDVQVYGKK